MKTTLFVMCFLCATAALGQTSVGGSVLSSEPRVFRMSSHQERASQRSVEQEQDLLEKSHLLYARGERPLWEVASNSYVMPLGDVARLLRKEHETAKKATRVWEN
ncbi:MAG: hypothetical protein LAN63_18775 [Acidobacteriia bacterium]|nr:hypothetical protein [Terriglobia bacterium]